MLNNIRSNQFISIKTDEIRFMDETPKIIKGASFSDQRGMLRFVNDFSFHNVKRFYIIKHTDKSTVRAWQGHQYENKYFFPLSGSFVVAWVKIDNFNNPSLNLEAHHHIISSENSEILAIPKGYANGLKAVTPGAEILVFSDMDLEGSTKEKCRYSANLWFDWSKF